MVLTGIHICFKDLYVGGMLKAFYGIIFVIVMCWSFEDTSLFTEKLVLLACFSCRKTCVEETYSDFAICLNDKVHLRRN